MKTSLSHLPEEKQEELALIKEIILANAPAEKSAQNDWRWCSIEDKIRERKWLTDTHIIAHGIGLFNEKIKENYYFFKESCSMTGAITSSLPLNP
ncbi:MAG: hypothetical protein MI674_05365 [Cytophagales bacterium]|jgi:hypothetical protein|nr:hypothetical protein [Cytophagales bacterium]